MIFLTNPLHYALHHNLRWQLAKEFSFALGQQTVEVARGELNSLATHILIAIRSSNRQLQVVALLAPQHYQQPLIGTGGSWTRGPVPVTLRYHPFSVIGDANDPGRLILGIAADPAYLTPDVGEAFFDHLAQPLPRVSAVHRRLIQTVNEKKQLNAAAQCLHHLGVLKKLDVGHEQGRATYATIDIDAISNISPTKLATASARPQDVLQLAAALDLSAGLFAEAQISSSEMPNVEKGSKSAVARARPAPTQTATNFLVDDDFIMTFDT